MAEAAIEHPHPPCVIGNPEADHDGMPCWSCWCQIRSEHEAFEAEVRKLRAALETMTEERDALRDWVDATVLMVELNALDAEAIKSIQHTGHELLGRDE